MPYWTHLLQTPTFEPVRQRKHGTPVAAAADLTPLGWLAAFTPDDVRAFVPDGGPGRFLTLSTSLRLAHERLVRRRDVLRSLVQLPLAEHLELFTETLGALDGRAGLQVWLHELVSPFPDDPEARGLLSRALGSFDEPSTPGLEALGELLLADVRPSSPRLLFHSEVAVMKTVGWLEGRRGPARDDALAPAWAALGEASKRLAALGHGLIGLRLATRAAARELAGPCEHRDDVLAALEAWNDGTHTLEEQLEGRPLDFRRALIAELAAGVAWLDHLPTEDDPRLSAALAALGAGCGVASALPAALESPDVRVRAAAALAYPPKDPLEDDEDDVVAPLDAIWERLARDPEPRVRWAACINQSSPLEPGGDPHPAVRALRRATPLTELLSLARADEPLGLATVFNRRDTPGLVHREALHTLGIDPQLGEAETGPAGQ